MREVGFKEHTPSTLMKTNWDITGDGGAVTPDSRTISKVVLTQEFLNVKKSQN